MSEKPSFLGRIAKDLGPSFTGDRRIRWEFEVAALEEGTYVAQVSYYNDHVGDIVKFYGPYYTSWGASRACARLIKGSVFGDPGNTGWREVNDETREVIRAELAASEPPESSRAEHEAKLEAELKEARARLAEFDSGAARTDNPIRWNRDDWRKEVELLERELEVMREDDLP
jgi:hypothetical protein